jgi:hypothetical protein
VLHNKWDVFFILGHKLKIHSCKKEKKMQNSDHHHS